MCCSKKDRSEVQYWYTKQDGHKVMLVEPSPIGDIFDMARYLLKKYPQVTDELYVMLEGVEFKILDLAGESDKKALEDSKVFISYRRFIPLKSDMKDFEELFVRKELSREDLEMILKSIKLNNYICQ